MKGNIPRPNPFVGLRPFTNDESTIFFGRTEQTSELLQKLHDTRFLAIVGSSGCGKSSLIRAGLIPKLKAGFLVDDRDRWYIATLKPGISPLSNLASSLIQETIKVASDKDELKLTEEIKASSTKAILQYLSPLLKNSDQNLLIMVDQFEEIFRYRTESDNQVNEDDAKEFVTILLELAQQRDLPIYIVITMRSEFLGDCDRFYGFPEALNRSQYLVPRLSRLQRREAIEVPIKLYGQHITSRLVDQLLNDIGDEPDQLPLLQHALMRMWECWAEKKSGSIDLDHYNTIGRIDNALSQHAEEAMKDMTEEEVQITKRLFQAITDTDKSNRQIRRPARLGEIEQLIGEPREKIIAIIERFQKEGRYFLTLSPGQKESDPMVDISHESLIRQWKRLKEWVEEEAKDKTTYLKVVEAAQEHQQGLIDAWRDSQLQLSLDWKKQKNPTKAWAQRYHEDFDSAMQFLNKSKQRRNRSRLLKFISPVIALIIIFLIIFINQNQKAELNKRLAANIYIGNATKDIESKNWIKAGHSFARTSTLENKSDILQICMMNVYQLNKPLFLSSILNSINVTNGISFSANEKFLLSWRLDSTVYLWKTPFPVQPQLIHKLKHNVRIIDATFNKDESLILSWSDDGTANLWHTEGGTPAVMPMKHQARINGAEFSHDEKLILTWSDDNTTHLWHTKDGSTATQPLEHNSLIKGALFNKTDKLVLTWSNDRTARLWNSDDGSPACHPMIHEDVVNGAMFNNNDDLILTWSADGTARLWAKNKNWQEILKLSHNSIVDGAVFNQTGDLILTWDRDALVHLWHTKDGLPATQPMRHDNWLNGACFSPDEKWILTWSDDGTARLWSYKNGTSLHCLIQLHDKVIGATFNKDCKFILTWCADGTARVWKTEDGSPATQEMYHDGEIKGAAFIQDEQSIVTWGSDGIVKFWQFKKDFPVLQVMEHKGEVNGAIFNKNEKLILSCGRDNTARLWNSDNGKNAIQPMAHEGSVWGAIFNKDESLILTWSDDNTARLWQTKDGSLAIKPMRHNDWVNGAMFSPDEKLILTWSDDRTARLWNTSDGSEFGKPFNHDWSVVGAAFNRAGDFILTWSSDGTARLWRIGADTIVIPPLKHNGPLNGAIFNKDESQILTWSQDDTAQIWNAKDGSPIFEKPINHGSNIWGACFLKDENLILTWARDGTAKLWSAKDGSLILNSMKHDGPIDGALVSHNEKYILTWSEDGTLRLWNVADGTLAAPIMKHDDWITGAMFNEDESMILSWSRDGTVRLWNTKDGKLVIEPLEHKSWVNGAAFNKEENLILTWCCDGSIRLWDFNIDYDFPKKYLPLFVEIITGTKMDDYGNISALSANDWNAKKQKYIEIAEKHLKECKYKNANLYLKQSQVWQKD